MTKRHTFFTLAMSSLLIGACAPLANLQLATGSLRLEVLPRLVAGEYRAQAVVAPWLPEAVEHVEIRLLALGTADRETPALVNGQPVIRDVPRMALGEPVTLTGLAPHSRYRLRARAYKARGLEPADLISDEAASFVDVVLVADDRPAVATLSIRLKDVPFDGQGTIPALDLLAGTLAPVGTESLQLGSQASE